MKVDIVLVSYNQEKYIAQAVESILIQRVNPDVQARLIIADDCSTDDTLNIIKTYEKISPFPFVYIDAVKNIGVSKNYQRAFAMCEGDYVAILEGDDWWCDKDRLQKHLDYLDCHIEVCYSKNALYLFNQHDNTWTSQFENANSVITLQDLIFDNQLMGNLSSCVIKTKILKKIRSIVYDYSCSMNIGCDWYLGLEMLQYGVGYILHDIMSVYRIGTGDNISRKTMTSSEEINQIKEIYYYANKLFDSKYLVCFNNLYAYKKCEISNKTEYLFKTKLEQYIPPIFIRLYEVLLKVFKIVKGIVKLFIPQKIYRYIKK